MEREIDRLIDWHDVTRLTNQFRDSVRKNEEVRESNPPGNISNQTSQLDNH